ncbi:hypothetical protein DRN63_01870 [Nanoarchaeota archaeon]|nr:MAG: hypothetical protein DRN63_01870 [Nanoarchaeota archaeon]
MSKSSSSKFMKTRSACPKRVLNGPCGGMRSDGTCEVLEFKCVFYENYPSELLLDDGFKIKPRIKHREYFTKLLSRTYERITWIAEIPPKAGITKKLHILRETTEDALSIPDNPLGRTHIEPTTFAAYLRNLTESEIVVHLTCRDLNRLALKSRILGLDLIGVKHVLALTGDHISPYEGNRLMGVFDLDSMRLIYMIRLLSDYGLDERGRRITDKVTLHVGGGLNPYLPLEIELSRILRKLNSGSEFFISQIIFDESYLIPLLKELRREGINVPIFAGFLLQDYDKIVSFTRTSALPLDDVPKNLDKLIERYLESLRKLRREYKVIGAYVSTLGKLEYLRTWSEYITGSF